MKKYQLDAEEKRILRDYNAGIYIPVGNLEKEKKKLEEAARYTTKLMKTKKKVVVNLSEMDVKELKSKAAKTGMSYQSLIQSLIHKFLQRPDTAV